jgi:signal transduction histidine kinase/ligand-binding sensor domain-containing protein/AraC-like DNA-binding protein/ActR/RegA family two-component response regulator
MLQDRKGFMWFATWDGLCRFDGFEFATYKIYPSNPYQMKNTRIDHILEDRYGYIWLQTYDGEVHRFDPRTETFEGIHTLPEYSQINFFDSRILLTPSGNKNITRMCGGYTSQKSELWILPDQSGCICVEDSLLHARVYLQDSRLKNNRVLNIFEDCKQNVWLLTNNGLHRRDANTHELSSFFVEKADSGAFHQSFFCAEEWTDGEIFFGSNNGRIWIFDRPSNAFRLQKTAATSDICDIKQLNDNEILIITSQNGFFIADREMQQIQTFDVSTLPGMCSNVILSAHIDGYRNLWLETDRLGVSKFNLQNRTMKHFSKPSYSPNPPPTFFVIEDVKGRVWVHPKGGGFALYDAEKDDLISFCNQQDEDGPPFSDTFHSAFVDRQGNLWISSLSNGLEKVVFDNNEFRIEWPDPKKQSKSSNEIRALFEDHEGNCWIATKSGTILLYNEEGLLLGYLQDNGMIGPSPHFFPDAAYCIIQDRKDNMWIGTKSGGLFRAKKRSNTTSLSFSLEQFRKNPDDIYSLSDDAVYSIFEDRKGHLWIGTFGGGLNLVENPETDKLRFVHYRNNLKNYPMDNGYRVRFITEDNHGNICVGTTLGLFMFRSDFPSPDNIDYTCFARIPGDKESLSNNDIHHIKITASGEMFIAAFGGGINRVTEFDEHGFPLRFKSYTKQDGLPSDLALFIEEDNNALLWITLQNNLIRFNPGTETFQTFGEIKRLMKMESFSEGPGLFTRSHRMLVGMTMGILSFVPENIKSNTFRPYIAFENFQLYNKDVGIGNNSPLSVNIDDMKELVLSHKQNFFSIKYAALDYDYPHNIVYAYMLEGVDSDWRYVRKQQIATYTNIPKGRYVFRVRSTNSDGIWTDNERSLPIHIHPSFWETGWAYFLYALAFVILLFVVARILVTIYGLKTKVRLEHEMAEMKLRFFTDISHEIRTPLTMVTAPVDFLLQNPRLSDDVRYQLQLVETNTNRMLRLVNQILDFRKMQHHPLEMEDTDISVFAEEICSYFNKTAQSAGIDFHYTSQVEGQKIVTDRDAVEKILFNLLSNAFKYTPAGKSIRVTLYKNAKGICLEVKDEGKGISIEKQKRLFTRFAAFNEDNIKPSTGIGLSIVKELADKLKATVSVDSEPDKGATFTICFPFNNKHLKDEIETHTPTFPPPGQDPGTAPEVPDFPAGPDPGKPGDRPSVLIVEDDDDLRRFLHSILGADYRVWEAADGKDGYTKAQESIPDLIVSDIMMPRLNGVQLLERLKNNLNTSHIPVVLLTAKTTIESKLEGLEYGADDYITKPFSVPYFRARIRNLLEQRERLQELYRSQLPVTGPGFEPKKPDISRPDDLFMSKVMQLIEENMTNSNFYIEDIAESTGVSRSVFFKKIKSLTGLAPVEFVRDIRIQRAGQLLATGQLSIKETAYRIGMSDMSYFRKCFKYRFGVNPSEYQGKKLPSAGHNR